MKKILSFLLVIIGLGGYSQDEYYRKVDWKFYPDNVVQLTDSTYLTDAIPFDYNDVGAIQRVVGNYVVDFVGHRYEVIDSTTTTITVLDIYHIGQAPQTGQIARCYRSVGDGEAEYIGSIDYSPLDESSRWKLNGSDNELLWRQTLGKAENGLYKDLRTVKLGGDLVEPTTINQDDNSLKILNNGHGSVFSETGIAYTKIDTTLFGDSTLITKMYANSRISDAAYSSLWNSIATVAPSKNAVYDKIETLTPVNYCPLSMTVNTGTLAQGSVSDLCEVGGTDVIISESTGADPLRVTFAFNPVQRLTSFSFYGRYNGGATHVTYLEAYNYVAAEWQLIGELGNTPVKQWQSYNIFLPNNFIGTGTVQVRFNHQGNGINTHQLILDYVDVNYGGAGGSSFETASEIAFIPNGNIPDTNVQAAIQKLDAIKEPLLTKGNLTAGSSKVTIGGTGTGAIIGAGVSVDVNQANLTLSSIGGAVTDAQVPNTLTLDNITQITNRSHTSLSNIGTNTHPQIDTFIASKGQNNGLATLDAGGKVPFSQLPASLMIYKGTWSPLTNTPTLADGIGTSGWVYKASLSGSVNLGSGIISFYAGDWVIYNGTTWERSVGTDNVVSVNGQQGIVSLNTSHIPENTNLYYTDSRTRAAISLTTTGNSGASTYNNSTGTFNIPTYTLSGLGGEPAFIHKTGFNLDLGTTTGTVLEGRTFGTAANSAVTDFAPASGSANYIWNGTGSQTGNFNITGRGVMGAFTIGAVGYQQSLILNGSDLLFADLTTSIGQYYGGNKLHFYNGSGGLDILLLDQTNNSVIVPNGFINTTGYKLSGVDLFSSLSAGSRTKWDGTKLVDDTDTFAPASGSANYIWNQNSVNQNANMWINSGRFGNDGIDIGGDFGTKYGAISVRKNLTGTFANGYHGFEDNSAISITGGLIAYAAFSATPVIVNDLAYDHLVGMQSQPTISSAASVDRLDGFASGINLGSGGASINKLSGLHVFDYSGTATVANNYGILLENIDNGTNNYSIYAKSGKMYLGADDIELFYGNLQISGRNKYLFLPTCQGKIGDSEGIFTGGSAFNLGISGYSGGGIDIGTGVTKHIELTNSGETFILNGNVHISAAAKYFIQESSQSKFGDASGIFTGGSGIDTGLSAYSGGNLILGTGVTPHMILANSGLLKINSLSGTGTRLVASQSDGTLANISNASGYLYNDGTNMVWIKTVPQSLSGTTPTLNASNGVNANLSISGATTLTLSNLISGTSGTIYLTNNASVYRIKIAGYTIAPASNITYDSTGILLPASSVWAHTSIGWYYNGTTVQIHKADYNSITY